MASDLQYVEACSKRIAQVVKTKKIVVEKSTLPVRTAEKIKEILHQEGNGVSFEVLSNPEFLAEGTAIKDLFKSDRVLIGGDATPSGQEAVASLVEIYTQWIPKEKILTTNVWSSELAKLASNAMLAQRISSINSLSALCEKTGADINELSQAIGMDHRIGPKFLKASVGFGGSCFQKDILNLVYLSKYYGLEEVAEYWHQVVKINDYQKNRFTNKIIESFKENSADKKITILGWSFKPNTNDSRESPAIAVASSLLNAGFELNVYDPKVPDDRIREDLKKISFNSSKLNIRNSLEEAIESAQAVAILTEWKQFSKLDLTKHKLFNGTSQKMKSEYNYQIGT
jgi:UDPglucose 6-dehydrogenase